MEQNLVGGPGMRRDGPSWTNQVLIWTNGAVSALVGAQRFQLSCSSHLIASLCSALIQQICIAWVTDALILSSTTADLADTGTFKHRPLSQR